MASSPSSESYSSSDKGSRKRRKVSSEDRHSSSVWGKTSVNNEKKPKLQNKEEPNFRVSGKLTEDTNSVNGAVVKYTEPEDAKIPEKGWRLYQFKKEKNLPPLHLYRHSAYLFGKDCKVADILLKHRSCSKQHAAFQFRLIPYTRENGTWSQCVRPYLIDLDSANGTFINGVKLIPKKYYELHARDLVKFGNSSRDYVLLHEDCTNENMNGEVPGGAA